MEVGDVGAVGLSDRKKRIVTVAVGERMRFVEVVLGNEPVGAVVALRVAAAVRFDASSYSNWITPALGSRISRTR